MCENKLVVDDIEVIVRGIKNRPYYEIKYREVGNDDYNIGFGSYDLNNVIKWKEEEFEVVSEKAEKETKEVTNEEIMEHLEEIELANLCILLGVTNIFQFILKRKEKYNVEKYEEMAFESGIEAMQYQSERMLNMSKIKEKILIKT